MSAIVNTALKMLRHAVGMCHLELSDVPLGRHLAKVVIDSIRRCKLVSK